jgi:hypothetical protein
VREKSGRLSVLLSPSFAHTHSSFLSFVYFSSSGPNVQQEAYPNVTKGIYIYVKTTQNGTGRQARKTLSKLFRQKSKVGVGGNTVERY